MSLTSTGAQRRLFRAAAALLALTFCLAPAAHAQHDGERGDLPERQQVLLPGETPRRRLGIPMFMGDVH